MRKMEKFELYFKNGDTITLTEKELLEIPNNKLAKYQKSLKKVRFSKKDLI
jgi:hypothetical protein